MCRWWRHKWSKWETFELHGNRHQARPGQPNMVVPFSSVRQKRICADCGREEWRTIENAK